MTLQKTKLYAIPAISAFICNQWAEEISDLLQTSPEEIRTNGVDLFGASLSTVRIELMDDSIVEFRMACCIVSGGKRAIAILTEHCGYHIFPIHQAKIYRDGELVYQQIGANYP